MMGDYTKKTGWKWPTRKTGREAERDLIIESWTLLVDIAINQMLDGSEVMRKRVIGAGSLDGVKTKTRTNLFVKTPILQQNEEVRAEETIMVMQNNRMLGRRGILQEVNHQDVILKQEERKDGPERGKRDMKMNPLLLKRTKEAVHQNSCLQCLEMRNVLKVKLKAAVQVS